MKSMFRPTVAFSSALRNRFLNVPDWTDDNCTVKLVEGDFDPEDPTTWPAGSSTFTALDSDGNPTIEYDAVSEQYLLVWPEPAGGWTFTAGSITTPITISGFTVDVAGAKIGANLIDPVTFTATGQVLALPEVCQGIPADVVDPGETPITL